MTKTFVNIFLLVFVIQFCKAEKTDSLLNFYQNLPNDSTKIIALYDLAFEYRIKDATAAKQFALACLKSAETTNNKKLLSKAYNISGILLYRSGHLANARIMLMEALRYLQELKDQPGIAQININLGNLEQLSGRVDKALLHFEESEKIFAQLGKSEALNQCLLNKGTAYFDLKKTEEAYHAFMDAMKLAIDRKDQYLESAALNNLSVIFREQKKLEESLNAANKAFAINDLIENEVEKADNYLSIGETYHAMGLGDSAIYYFKMSQAIAEKESYAETEKEVCQLLVPILESKGDYKEALYYQKRLMSLNRQPEIFSDLDASFVIQKNNTEKSNSIYPIFLWATIGALSILIAYLLFQKSKQK